MRRGWTKQRGGQQATEHLIQPNDTQKLPFSDINVYLSAVT